MMYPSEGLYKGPAEMLYSGALSAAPHNCVDADAAAVAPPERHQNRGRFFGPSRKNLSTVSLSGGHDGERLVRADPPRNRHVSVSVLTHVRAAQLEPR